LTKTPKPQDSSKWVVKITSEIATKHHPKIPQLAIQPIHHANATKTPSNSPCKRQAKLQAIHHANANKASRVHQRKTRYEVRGKKNKNQMQQMGRYKNSNTICTEQQFATCNPQKAHN